MRDGIQSDKMAERRVNCEGVTEEELKNALRRLKKGKVGGTDGTTEKNCKYMGSKAKRNCRRLIIHVREGEGIPEQW